jgi:hypothetical protein
MRRLLVFAALLPHMIPPRPSRPVVVDYDGQTYSVPGDSFTSITTLGLYVGDLMAKGVPCCLTDAARDALTRAGLGAADMASAKIILAYAGKE